MTISIFFQDLYQAYVAEIDDMQHDSEGQDVLQQRLDDRRSELGFLLSMTRQSPEMLAAVLHHGFSVSAPAVLDHLIELEPQDFPAWSELAAAVELAPWAKPVAETILKEATGPWLLTVAAGLEYMHFKHLAARAQLELEQSQAKEGAEEVNAGDGAETDEMELNDSQAKDRDEAGAQWLVEQGFDAKHQD
jgi:hypothetical protein